MVWSTLSRCCLPRPGDADVAGGSSELPDLSLEGPFDVHQDRPVSGASPRVLSLVVWISVQRMECSYTTRGFWSGCAGIGPAAQP